MVLLQRYSIFVYAFYLFLLLLDHPAPSIFRRSELHPTHMVVHAQQQQLYIQLVAGNGTAGYNGENRLATTALLNLPAGGGNVWGNSNGVLYVADFSNYRIRSINLQGIIITIAGKFPLLLVLYFDITFVAFYFSFFSTSCCLLLCGYSLFSLIDCRQWIFFNLRKWRCWNLNFNIYPKFCYW
jgi:hypothetical protein